jgi:hypothetical protein
MEVKEELRAKQAIINAYRDVIDNRLSVIERDIIRMSARMNDIETIFRGLKEEGRVSKYENAQGS